jgi:hypothetical protein
MARKGGRWVAKLVLAHPLATAALWFESRHLSKIQNGRHKQTRGQHTQARHKKEKKKKKGTTFKIMSHLLISLNTRFVLFLPLATFLTKIFLLQLFLRGGEL